MSLCSPPRLMTTSPPFPPLTRNHHDSHLLLPLLLHVELIDNPTSTIASSFPRLHPRATFLSSRQPRLVVIVALSPRQSSPTSTEPSETSSSQIQSQIEIESTSNSQSWRPSSSMSSATPPLATTSPTSPNLIRSRPRHRADNDDRKNQIFIVD